MDLETLYRRTVESWTARVQTVGADQWTAVTPCADWDVRELVNHVVGEDLLDRAADAWIDGCRGG